MARYTGPIWRISRRLKFSILEDGRELKKRPYAPGQHGQRRTKQSEYGLQLAEKQKVCYTYGLNEKQFRNLFVKASKQKGKTGEVFLFMLESRLDNLVYRLGFAVTRAQARQLVNHGHVLVDGKKVDIPSYLVKPGQTISLRQSSRNLEIVKAALESVTNRVGFVSFDENTLTGTYLRYPERQEILPEIRENLIVEFYNR